MARLGLRLAMVGVGAALLVAYLLAALLFLLAFRVLWANRPDPAVAAATVLGLAVLFGYLSFRFGTRQLLASLDATEVPPERAPALHRRVDALCDRMGMDPPRLLVAEMPVPNAIALGGAGWEVIVVDRALARLLTMDELAAVLAHELAHLESNDGLVQTLAYSAIRTLIGLVTVVIAPLVLLLAGAARAVAWISGRPGAWGSNPFGWLHVRVGHAVMVLLVVLTLFVFAHSRRREIAADDRAVSVTGDPLALARALRKIERAAAPPLTHRTPLYIHGEEERPLPGWLSTHPPMDERVDRLVQRAVRDRRRDGR